MLLVVVVELVVAASFELVVVVLSIVMVMADELITDEELTKALRNAGLTAWLLYVEVAVRFGTAVNAEALSNTDSGRKAAGVEPCPLVPIGTPDESSPATDVDNNILVSVDKVWDTALSDVADFEVEIVDLDEVDEESSKRARFVVEVDALVDLDVDVVDRVGLDVDLIERVVEEVGEVVRLDFGVDVDGRADFFHELEGLADVELVERAVLDVELPRRVELEVELLG